MTMHIQTKRLQYNGKTVNSILHEKTCFLQHYMFYKKSNSPKNMVLCAKCKYEYLPVYSLAVNRPMWTLRL